MDGIDWTLNRHTFSENERIDLVYNNDNKFPYTIYVSISNKEPKLIVPERACFVPGSENQPIPISNDIILVNSKHSLKVKLPPVHDREINVEYAKIIFDQLKSLINKRYENLSEEYLTDMDREEQLLDQLAILEKIYEDRENTFIDFYNVFSNENFKQ